MGLHHEAYVGSDTIWIGNFRWPQRRIAMALGSVASMLKWSGMGADLAKFFGTPIIALGLGTLIAVAVLASTRRMGEFYDVTNETLKVVGPILFITAAGVSISFRAGFFNIGAQGQFYVGAIFAAFAAAYSVGTMQG